MMGVAFGEQLHLNGRAHALSSQLLYISAIRHAEDYWVGNSEQCAFNDTFSLSINYLVGLGPELILKAAYVLHNDKVDDGPLPRVIGHDLLRALDLAEEQGFASDAPDLRAIVELLREPYKAQHFRYLRPKQMLLPPYRQIVDMFAVLDDELATALR